MRVELLFFRWLVVIGLIALAVSYARSSRQDHSPPQYSTIRLVEDGKSSGMALAGIAIDTNRRDVYAIVGGPAGEDPDRQFSIVWKDKNGETYGTSFPRGGAGDALFVIGRDGGVRELKKILDDTHGANPSQYTASTETTLRSIVDALPDGPRSP